jgi:probable H4MPT-linked C1 transfer pathway protein
MRILGWDIGGVNTKAALVADGIVRQVLTRPFELQRSPDALSTLLNDMARALSSSGADAHAVTMTAELSQMFRTKREGVGSILDAVERAFPDAVVHVYTTDGSFIPPETARAEPLRVAAANWVATANLVARHHPDGLLVDIGTTTTDLIPLCHGRESARGRTDTERLTYGELVYSGVVRTPVEAIVDRVTIHGQPTRVSAEGFALVGDAHVWLGDLRPEDYDAATPDGRAPSRTFAGERLARVVCADRDLLDDEAITRIAATVTRAQQDCIATAIRDIVAVHPSIATAVVTGLGAFVGARAAEAAGLRVVPLSQQLGDDGARSAPATAVALLLHERLGVQKWGEPCPAFAKAPARRGEAKRRRQARQRGPDTVRATNKHQSLIVVKLGGSLLADPQQWRAALSTLTSAAKSYRLVIVPGGGPFADAVRSIDERFGLSDDAAHWMAIAGMEQHAEMIAATGAPFVRVEDAAGVTAAHAANSVPDLALVPWLRATDPLPHSWDVTSDSIAAWVSGQLKAARLVVIKSAGATGSTLLDPTFVRTLPQDLPWVVCDAFELEAQFASLAPSPR